MLRHARRAAPLLLFARQHRAAAAAEGDGDGSAKKVGTGVESRFDLKVQLLLGVSPQMRNSTYFLGVAAGMEAWGKRKNKKT